MDAKTLVNRALRGEPVPRVPSGPLAVHFCAKAAGISIREYTTQPKKLAEAVVRYYERFRPDAIWISADTWVSAEAMGAKVGAETDDQPFGGLGGPCIQTPADLERIPPPSLERGRYPLMLEALAHVKAALGNDAFIVACFDQYPFSLASALLGINETMLLLSEDQPFVEAVMERALEYACTYAGGLAAAGADMLSGGDSPAGLIGPQKYRAVAWPYEQRLVARLKAATGKPVSLHICGQANPLLRSMGETGADVLEIDSLVGLSAACQLVGPNVALWGNLDPVQLLAQSSPAQVRQAAASAGAAVKAAGHSRFVLSSGCTLAVETPAENLAALINACQNLSI